MNNNIKEVVFSGTREQCRQFAVRMERQDYTSVRVAPVNKDSDEWEVIATLLWAPSPEEIEAAIAPLREHKKKHPSYSDSITTASAPKSRDGRTASERPRVSKAEENVMRTPQGWRQ